MLSRWAERGLGHHPLGAPLACLLGQASGPQQWGAALHPWILCGSCLDWCDQSPWGVPPAAPFPLISAHSSGLPSAWPSQRGPGLLLEGQCGRDARALPGPLAGLCQGVPREDPSQLWRGAFSQPHVSPCLSQLDLHAAWERLLAASEKKPSPRDRRPRPLRRTAWLIITCPEKVLKAAAAGSLLEGWPLRVPRGDSPPPPPGPPAASHYLLHVWPRGVRVPSSHPVGQIGDSL